MADAGKNSYLASLNFELTRMKEKFPEGATILGVILSSDKTTISIMTGNQVAYPLLISLANIKKDYRLKNSNNAFQILALLPVAKFIH